MKAMHSVAARLKPGLPMRTASRALLRTSFLLVALGALPVRAETNEEWGRRLRKSLQEFREQTDRQRRIPQRPPRAEAIDSNGNRHSLGPWEEVRRNRASSDHPGPAIPSPGPDQHPEAQADAALARGDYDEAVRLLELARTQSPDPAALIPRINAVRSAKLANEVRAVNVRRGVELHRVLDQAARSLPAQLRSPSPAVALASVAPEPLSDASVIDLRGVQFLVVDPAFFKSTGAAGNSGGKSARRFIEPPEPGKTLSPVAFAGSPYVAVFETPEFEALMLGGLGMEPARQPGESHRARAAFLRRIDALPPQSIHVVTTASDEEFQASRAKVKTAYQEYRKRRKALLGAAVQSSLREMKSMLQGMEDEGWFKRGDDLVAKTASDPLLKATLDERARVVRWYAELYLDEAEDRAYRELALRVTRIMKENDKP
ncbi:MAG: hypothetical protein HYZ13_00635 [Acidobacteria bacterium]|nr:hypothetical protein [Acidobacteriota bacterium]